MSESYDKQERRKVCYDIIVDFITENRSAVKHKILDVGMGNESLLKRFVGLCEVFGVDISQELVDKAALQGIKAYKVDISSEKLPFEDQTFDIVFMGETIEHIVNPDFAIQEVRRVLKPSGFLLLTTPNLACWYNRLLLLFGYQPVFSEVSTLRVFGRPGRDVAGHLRLFTLKALKEFLNYHGFIVVRIKGVTFDVLPRPLRVIDKTIFSKMPSLASNVVIVARLRLNCNPETRIDTGIKYQVEWQKKQT